jgi:hypothetical protein
MLATGGILVLALTGGTSAILVSADLLPSKAEALLVLALG